MSPFELGILTGLSIGALASPVVLVLCGDVVRAWRAWRGERRAVAEYREETRRYVRAVAPSLRTPAGWRTLQ